MCYVLLVKEKECGHSILVLENKLQVHQVYFLFFMVDHIILVMIGWHDYRRMKNFYY
jgi:hypothetical protein